MLLGVCVGIEDGVTVGSLVGVKVGVIVGVEVGFTAKVTQSTRIISFSPNIVKKSYQLEMLLVFVLDSLMATQWELEVDIEEYIQMQFCILRLGVFVGEVVGF